MSKQNKFAFLSDRTASTAPVEEVVEEEREAPMVSPAPAPAARQSKARLRSLPKEQPTPPEPLPEPPARKMGRPRGKRSDPNYEQITAYIRKETHLEVKASLLRDPEGRDFSELIQELLDEYLRTQISSNAKV